MREAADSIVAGSEPAGFDIYLGYDDGRYLDVPAIRALLPKLNPNARVWAITVFPSDNEGDWLDVENGDANPADAPGWVARRRAAGHPNPGVYCSESVWPQVKLEFAAQRVPPPPYWIAGYPGSVGAGNLYPGAVGHQDQDVGPYDHSVFVDYIPGLDPAPTTPTTQPTSAPQEASSMSISPTFTHGGQKNVVQAAAGSLWHKWLAADGWHNETLAGPGGGTAAGCADNKVTVASSQPGVTLNADGSVDLTFEGADNSAWNVAQASGSSEWIGGRLP